MSVFQYLNSSVPMGLKLSRAWQALNDQTCHPTSEDRVAAKCWLIHRITDGTVAIDQWPLIEAVQPLYVNEDGLTVRWSISLKIAEMYLHGLRRGDFAAMRGAALEIRYERSELHRWPPCILNYLRAMAVLALGEELPHHVTQVVCESIQTWQKVVGGMDWYRWPMRLIELRDDLSALWQLVAIGRQCGAVQYEQFAWLPKFCGGTDQFAQLMRLLNAPQL